MNYWIVLAIILGWFPVMQTILHLEERDYQRMSARLVYTTESRPETVKVSVLCCHGKDAGQTCYPCDTSDDEWLATEAADTFNDRSEDREMEHWLWFGTPDNPIL